MHGLALYVGGDVKPHLDAAALILAEVVRGCTSLGVNEISWFLSRDGKREGGSHNYDYYYYDYYYDYYDYYYDY